MVNSRSVVPPPGSADGAPRWVDALEAVYEAAADRIANVLPPPLEPGPEPLVRVTIVAGSDAHPDPIDHAWLGVQARHGSDVGEYALLVGVATDHEAFLGRELLGEPRKVVTTTSLINGTRIQHKAERRGHVVARIVGTANGPSELWSGERTEFALRVLPPVEDAPGAPTADPGRADLMVLRRHITERRAVEVTGVVRVGSPFERFSGLTVRRMRSIRLSQRMFTVEGQRVGSVPVADLEPFLAHRYDRSPDEPDPTSSPPTRFTPSTELTGADQ